MMPSPAEVYGAPVPVLIVGADQERLPVSIYPEWAKAHTVPPLARCYAPCTLQMQRGAYRIAIDETGTTMAGDRVVTVDQASRLVVTPRSPSQRTAGLILGIAGPVLLIAGAIIAIEGAATDCLDEFCDNRRWTGKETAGVIMMLGGAAITPVGWVMFGKSFRPAIDVQPGRPVAKLAPAVGLIPVRGGLALGGGMSF
jgi:hypothetical protein